MRLAKVLSAAGFVIMTFMIVRAFVAGDFNAEGGAMLAGAWGQLSLVDVYIGFLVFLGWVIFREQSWWRSALWAVAILVLGNAITCLYVFLALNASGGDWRRFWLGRHA